MNITVKDKELANDIRWLQLDAQSVKAKVVGESRFHAELFKATGSFLDFVFAPYGNETPSNDEPHFKVRMSVDKYLPITTASVFLMDYPVMTIEKVSHG